MQPLWKNVGLLSLRSFLLPFLHLLSWPIWTNAARPLPAAFKFYQCHIPVLVPLNQVAKHKYEANESGAATGNIFEWNAESSPFCATRGSNTSAPSYLSSATFSSLIWESAQVQLEVAFSLLAAAQIAMDHLFSNDDSVVKKLGDPEVQNCLLPFDRDSLTLYSSDRFRSNDVRKLLDIDGVCERGYQNKKHTSLDLCAAIVKLDTDTIDAFLAGAHVVGLPVLGFASTLPKITSQYFDVVVRNGPTLEQMATALVQYWEWNDRTAVAVLHDDSSYGSLFANLLAARSSTVVTEGVQVTSISFHAKVFGGFVFSGEEEDTDVDDVDDEDKYRHQGKEEELHYDNELERIRGVLQRIRSGGYHTIFVAFDGPEAIPLAAKAAVELDMVGPNYVWFFGDKTIPMFHVPLEEEDENYVFRLLQGSGVLHLLDGFSIRGGGEGNNDDENDAFLKAWREQDVTMVERIHEQLISFWRRDYDDQHRSVSSTSSSCLPFHAGPDYFQTHLPVQYASYVYDSVIATGVALCQVSRNIMRAVLPDVSSLTDNVIEKAWRSIVPTLFQNSSAFEGASGSVRFDDVSLSRETTTFGMYNMQLIENLPQLHQIDEGRRLTMVLTAQTTRGHEDDCDAEVNGCGWESVGTFRFRDGTSMSPPWGSQLVVQEFHYLSLNIRTMGLVLMTTSIVLSVVLAAYILASYTEKTIRRAQPLFLLLLCFGSMLSASSILPLSYDEKYGWTSNDLDRFCLATPWLFFLGYNCSYLALFGKLWRIDQVLQFTRRKVTVRQVLSPLSLLVFLATVCLTLWTVLDGHHWTREIVSTIPLETMGKCHSEWQTLVRFFIPLCVLTIASTVLTATMAWQTRDVSADFRESSGSIVCAILVQLQTWLVSLPVIVVLEDGGSRDASFLGYVALIWTFSVSMVFFVVGPTVAQSVRERLARNKDHRVRLGAKNVWISFGAAPPEGTDSRTPNTCETTQLHSSAVPGDATVNTRLARPDE